VRSVSAPRHLRILITGGLGFIGSHIVQRLVEHNRLIVLDNGRRDALRLSDPLNHPNLTIIRGDITTPETLSRALTAAGELHWVIHLAAMAGVTTYVTQPRRTIEVNLLGTARLLEALAGRSIERFINVSSSEVYGPRAYHAREDGLTALGPATTPRWSYAASKLAAEHLVLAYHHDNGLPVVSLRPFNIYGPGQIGEGAVRNFIVRALTERDLTIYGDGSQIRSWCYIEDLIDGLIAAALRPEASGLVFNLGNPRATVTVLDLAERIVQMCGSPSTVKLVPSREQEVELRVPDITLARRMLGINPRVTLVEGLERTIAWYREQLAHGVDFDS
jgi:nucleoside-diphosphate-sugar epimerase